MTGSDTESGEKRECSMRRIELSVVAKYDGENYLDADGNVDEDQMVREAMRYAEEAARDGALEVEITPIREME